MNGKPKAALGVVSAVTETSITLDAKARGPKKPGGAQTFSVSPQTKITKDDAPATVSQIMAGDWVTVRTDGSGMATRIAVHDVDDAV